MAKTDPQERAYRILRQHSEWQCGRQGAFSPSQPRSQMLILTWQTIIPAMKRRVFAGVVIVFSGVVALGTKPQDSDYWKTAETFGAKCLTEIRGEVTHVVANQVRPSSFLPRSH